MGLDPETPTHNPTDTVETIPFDDLQSTVFLRSQQLDAIDTTPGNQNGPTKQLLDTHEYSLKLPSMEKECTTVTSRSEQFNTVSQPRDEVQCFTDVENQILHPPLLLNLSIRAHLVSPRR